MNLLDNPSIPLELRTAAANAALAYANALGAVMAAPCDDNAIDAGQAHDALNTAVKAAAHHKADPAPSPAKYNFDRDLSTSRYTVKVDTAAQYGYFERNTGGEGGLWFNGTELIDYDGFHFLPREVGQALRDAGYTVDENCFADPQVTA